MSNSPIPNIPPLSSIKDEATRLAIKAIADQLAVRNGQVGTGEHKFLTVADLQDVVAGKSVRVGNGRSIAVNSSFFGAGGGGGSVLTELTASLQNSWLWKKLEERLSWIEMPSWFEKRFGAAIRTEQTLREEADYALAQQTTTAVTAINDNIALVQEELTATSDLAGATASSVTQVQTQVNGVQAVAQDALYISQNVSGDVNGSWTVKFDVNGYVVGAGLGLEGKNGSYSSSFVVKADRFAVTSPTGSVTPFVVESSGVYIRNVFMDFGRVTGNLSDGVSSNWFIGRNGATDDGDVYRFRAGSYQMNVNTGQAALSGPTSYVGCGYYNSTVQGGGALVSVGGVGGAFGQIQFTATSVLMDTNTKNAFRAALGIT